MKCLLLSLGLLASLAATSHAQFKLTTFDGKTVANKNKPDTSFEGMDSKFYFIWEADYVRSQWQTSIGDKLAISETLVYYVDVDLKNLKREDVPAPSGKGVGYSLELLAKKGNPFPKYDWKQSGYSQLMGSNEAILFGSKAERQKFEEMLIRKCKNAKAPIKRIVLKAMTKEKK